MRRVASRSPSSTHKDLTLRLMPELTPEFSRTAAGIVGRFLGHPAKLLGPDVEDEEEQEVDADGNPVGPIRFSEAHRLAATVAAIDADTAVVPRGAFTVTPTHHIAPSASFRGLSLTEGADTSSYFHFRAPRGEGRRALLSRAVVVGPGDFLDPLSEDSPGGTWAVR